MINLLIVALVLVLIAPIQFFIILNPNSKIKNIMSRVLYLEAMLLLVLLPISVVLYYKLCGLLIIVIPFSLKKLDSLIRRNKIDEILESQLRNKTTFINLFITVTLMILYMNEMANYSFFFAVSILIGLNIKNVKFSKYKTMIYYLGVPMAIIIINNSSVNAYFSMMIFWVISISILKIQDVFIKKIYITEKLLFVFLLSFPYVLTKQPDLPNVLVSTFNTFGAILLVQLLIIFIDKFLSNKISHRLVKHHLTPILLLSFALLFASIAGESNIVTELLILIFIYSSLLLISTRAFFTYLLYSSDDGFASSFRVEFNEAFGDYTGTLISRYIFGEIYEKDVMIKDILASIIPLILLIYVLIDNNMASIDSITYDFSNLMSIKMYLTLLIYMGVFNLIVKYFEIPNTLNTDVKGIGNCKKIFERISIEYFLLLMSFGLYARFVIGVIGNLLTIYIVLICMIWSYVVFGAIDKDYKYNNIDFSILRNVCCRFIYLSALLSFYYIMLFTQLGENTKFVVTVFLSLIVSLTVKIIGFDSIYASKGYHVNLKKYLPKNVFMIVTNMVVLLSINQVFDELIKQNLIYRIMFLLLNLAIFEIVEMIVVGKLSFTSELSGTKKEFININRYIKEARSNNDFA